jgi:hypothetical protein
MKGGVDASGLYGIFDGHDPPMPPNGICRKRRLG